MRGIHPIQGNVVDLLELAAVVMDGGQGAVAIVHQDHSVAMASGGREVLEPLVMTEMPERRLHKRRERRVLMEKREIFAHEIQETATVHLGVRAKTIGVLSVQLGMLVVSGMTAMVRAGQSVALVGLTHLVGAGWLELLMKDKQPDAREII